MLSPTELRDLVLAGGDTPERWLVWQRHFARGAPRKLRRLARELDLADKRVLDVGCGYGVYLAHFAAGSLGLDRLPERAAFARSLGLRAEVRDVETLGWHLGLGDFDLIWLCDILPHLDDPQPFLANLPRLLAPKGRIVFSEWVWPAHPGRARLLARCLPDGLETLENSEHRRYLTRASLARFLEQAGLEIETQWAHSVEQRWLGRLLQPVVPPRTIVARVRRSAPATETKPHAPPDSSPAVGTRVLQPHPADPDRRARDLRSRAVAGPRAQRTGERTGPGTGRRTGPRAAEGRTGQQPAAQRRPERPARQRD